MGYSEGAKRRKKQGERDGISGIVSACMRGVLISLAFALAISLALSGIAILSNDPDSLTAYFGTLTLYLSSLVCGFVSARSNKENWLLCGFSSGAVLMIFLWGASYLFGNRYSSNYPLFALLGMRALTVFMSALGAYMSNYLSKRKRTHRRRRR